MDILMAMDGVMQMEEVDEADEASNLRFPRIVVKDRSDMFMNLSEQAFVKQFRLTKECVKDLLAQIQTGPNKLPTAPNKRGYGVPPYLQLLVSLQYYGTGSFQISVGDCVALSTSSVCRFVRRTSRAITMLAPQHIKFPEPAETQPLIEKFRDIAQMPGVIGCVDGCPIPIKSPGGKNAEEYRCRKGFPSINMQGICTADLLFIDIVASWPGSVHDSIMFNNSSVNNILEQGNHPGYLLGDSAYACKPYLLTPFIHPQTQSQRNYNEAHIKTHNTIEHAFGALKRRFGCLAMPLRTKLETSKGIIMACAVLHNLAIRQRVPLEPNEPINLENAADIVRQQEVDAPAGNLIRNDVVERWF